MQITDNLIRKPKTITITAEGMEARKLTVKPIFADGNEGVDFAYAYDVFEGEKEFLGQLAFQLPELTEWDYFGEGLTIEEQGELVSLVQQKN